MAFLSLESNDDVIRSTFQAAQFSRPLMAMGKMCDGGMHLVFEDEKARVEDRQGHTVCAFHRKLGGPCVATMRLKRPFGRPA